MDESNNVEKIKQEMKVSQTIFSEEEIDETVKIFLLAYLHDKIRIDFPTSEEVKNNYQKSGTSLKSNDAYNMSVEAKKRFLDNLGICCGSIPSTSDELLKAKSELFRLIFLVRMNNRLKGSFLEFKEGERIKEFEDKLNATNNLVSKLLDTLTDESKE